MGAVLIGAGVVGAIIDGIGFWGVMITGDHAGAAAAYVLMRYPEMPMPTTESPCARPTLATLAGKTEMWLESQRPALPAPAVNHDAGYRPASRPTCAAIADARQQRSRPPAKCANWSANICPSSSTATNESPKRLKRKEHGGKTPEQQLVDGLKLIDREIETMTGQISRGELDKLAVRGRYLELKYDQSAEGVAN